VTIEHDENGLPLSLIDIRPMDLGDILDGTIRVYRRRPWVFVTILAIVVGIPMMITQTSTEYVQSLFQELLKSGDPAIWAEISNLVTSREYLTATGFMLFGGIILFFLAPIAQAAMVYAVSETILGRMVGLKQSINAIMPRAWKIIQAYILYFLIALGVLAVVAAAAYAIGAGQMEEIPGPGVFVGLLGLLLLLSLAMVFLTIKFIFIPHAIVLDNTGVIDGLKRSFTISNGYWWRTFGIYMIISVIIGIINGLLGQAVKLMGWGLSMLPGVDSMIIVASNGVVMTIISIILNPISFIATTLLYYDLRIRKEGFDLILLAESIGESSGEERTAHT
jgi:hypothetical protein